MRRAIAKRLHRGHLSGRSELPGASGTHPVPEGPNSGARGQISLPDSPPSGWQDFKNTAKGALWTILKIAKEASAAFPPARAAFSAAVAVGDVSDVSTGRPGTEIYNLTAFHDRNIRQTKTQSTSSMDVFTPWYESSTIFPTRKSAVGKFHNS